MAAAVSRFQESAGLVPDGLLGPRTRMALFALLAGRARPDSRRERRTAVSLILDALRKLERDKDPREPGVLVVGSVPWGAGRRSRRPSLLAAAALVALAFAGWWWLAIDPAPGRRRARTRRARTRRTRYPRPLRPRRPRWWRSPRRLRRRQ